MNMSMRVTGAKELEAALRELPKRIGRAALRRALQKVAQPIADDAARRAAQTKPKLGAHGISVSTKLGRRAKRGRRGVPTPGGQVVAVYIGAHSATRGVAHLIEFGTGPRYTKSPGKPRSGGAKQRRPAGMKTPPGAGREGWPPAGWYTGQMPARPFMRPAWDAGRMRAFQQLQGEIWTEVRKAAARLARRRARGTASAGR